LTGSQRGRHPG